MFFVRNFRADNSTVYEQNIEYHIVSWLTFPIRNNTIKFQTIKSIDESSYTVYGVYYTLLVFSF